MRIESKRNIAKYILAFGGVQGMNIAMGLVRNKLVALLLGPNGMGLLSLYSSSIQLLQNACNLGLDKSTIPSVSNAFEKEQIDVVKQHIKQIRSLFLLAALIAVGVSVASCWMLSLVAFSDFAHAGYFLALSPVVALLILSSGEMAILKATRQLKRLAALSMYNVVISLIASVPLFFLWGEEAIIPSFLLTTVIQFIVTIAFSYSRYPLHVSISRQLIVTSMPVIRLGVAFVIASTMTSGAEFLIRAYLNSSSGDAVVGLYNSAYMIAFTYGGVVFSALDAEYFPRLSKMNDNKELRATILRQIKVCLLVIVPMVAVLILLLPWIIPLLFSNRFTDAIPMAQITLLAMIFRAIYLPIGYLPLAKGDSRCFLLLESIGAIYLALSVVIGYNVFGLIGCGIGIVVANALDAVMNIIIVKHRYSLSLL